VPPRPQSTRHARPILLLGGALLALVLLVALGGPALLAPWIRLRAEAALSAALGRPVTVGAARLGPAFRQLELVGVTIPPAPDGAGPAVIVLPRVQLALRPWRLLLGRLAVRRVILTAPSLGLERPAGVPLGAYLAGVLPPPGAASAEAGGPWPEIHIHEARVSFRDAPRDEVITLEGIEATIAVTGPERVEVALRAAGGRWDLAGQRLALGAGDFAGTFDGPDLEIAAAQLTLGRSSFRGRGRIAALVAAPRAVLDLQAALALPDLRRFVPSLPRTGSLSLKGQLTGPLAQPQLLTRGTLALDAPAGESASLRLDYRDGTWRAHEIRGQAFGGFIEGALVARAGGQAEIRLRGEGLAVERLLAAAGHAETLRGRLAAELDLTLAPADLAGARGRVRLRGEALQWAAGPAAGEAADGPLGSLVADLQLAGTDRIGANLDLRVAGTEVEARGRITGSSGRSDLRLRARVADAARLGPLLGLPALRGTAALEGRLGGRLDAPRFRGRLRWERPLVGHIPLDLVEGDLEVGPTSLRSPRLLLRRGGTTALLGGAARLAPGVSVRSARLAPDLHLELRATVPAGRLEDLAAAAGLSLPVAGAVRIPELALAGPAGALTGQARASISELTILDEAWPGAEIRLTVKPTGLALDAVALRRGDERLDLTGEVGFGGALRLDVTTSALPLERLGPLRGVPITGAAAFALRASGSLRAPEVQGTARFARLTFADFALGSGEARLGYGLGRLELALPILGGSGQATGAVGPAPSWPFRFEIALRDAPLTAVLERAAIPALAGATASGSGRLTVTGEGRGPAPTLVEVQLGAAEVRALGDAWRSAEPVRLQWTRGGYLVQALRLSSRQGDLTLAGRGGPGGLDLRLEGRLPFAALAALVPGVRASAGTTEVRLALRGPAEAPAVTGSAEVRDGRFGLGTLPDDFTELAARLELREGAIGISRAEARLAEGHFRAKGELRRRPGGWEVALDFVEDGARVERLVPRTEGPRDRVTGTATIRGAVTTQAGDPWGTLAGTAALEFRNGRIGRHSVLARVLALLNIAKVLDLRLPDPPGQGMPYRRLAADFRIANGVATTEDGVLESDAMHATAVGTIDLATERLDLKLAVRPLQTVDRIVSRIPLLGWVLTGEQRGLVVAYFAVKGTFEDPSVTPLPIQSVGRGVLGIFRRLLGLPEHLLAPEATPRAP
jgi:hypothetical protein